MATITVHGPLRGLRRYFTPRSHFTPAAAAGASAAKATTPHSSSRRGGAGGGTGSDGHARPAPGHG